MLGEVVAAHLLVAVVKVAPDLLVPVDLPVFDHLVSDELEEV